MKKGERHMYSQSSMEMDNARGWVLQAEYLRLIHTNKILQCSVALYGYIYDTRENITILLLRLVLFPPHPYTSRSIIVLIQSRGEVFP